MKSVKCFIISLIAVGLMVGTSFGMGSLPPEPKHAELQKASVDIKVGSQIMDESTGRMNEEGTLNAGQTWHSADVYAQGTKEAKASASGFSTITSQNGYFQKEVKGGELSGAFSKTTGFSTVGSLAIGKDGKNSKCAPDFASSQLSGGGTLYQANAAFSDDRDSYIGGWNESKTVWVADKATVSTDGDWYSRQSAFLIDGLVTGGEAVGGTLVYAKQTDKFAVVAGITGNTGSAWALACDVDLEGTVWGQGGMEGMAILPGTGDAGFGLGFEYEGALNSYGLGGGVAFVTADKATVSSFVTTKSILPSMENGHRESHGQHSIPGVYGFGSTGGGASLVDQGYASYSASFEYDGHGPKANTGIAGGTATVKNVSGYGTTSSASAYSSVSGTNNGHGGNQGPQ